MATISFNKRINIFTGHYGSGKSEISVNAAFEIKKTHQDVMIADMDIVNPFFRSLDAKESLESVGIKVVAPVYANTNIDVPVVGPEITAALRNKNRHVILDVGGDEEGSRILGRFHADIPNDETEMFFVINRARPMTQNIDETLKYIQEIEEASRRKITMLINNTHYLNETTVDDVIYGLELAHKVSLMTGITLAASCVMEGLEKQLGALINHPIFVLRKNILFPFNS